jgi:hypothetical protein
MHEAAQVEFNEISRLPHLLQHTQRYQKSTNPKESVNCKISRRNHGGYAGSRENVDGLSPVLYVHKPKPLVVAKDNPEDRQHPRTIQKQQILILRMLRNCDYFAEVVVETKTLECTHWQTLTLRYAADQRTNNTQRNQDNEQRYHKVAGPIELRLRLHRIVEIKPHEGRKG